MANNAKNLFDTLTNEQSILNLIGKHEDPILDAKLCSVPFQDSDKDKLAKGMSGFSNSMGGILIYGLEAAGGNKHTPDIINSSKPIKKLSLLKSEVLSLVGQIVERPVSGVEVRDVELKSKPDEGFLLVYIPPSELGPHRSRRDYHFYRRHGFGTYRMELFEIEEMIRSSVSPLLNAEIVYNHESPCRKIGNIVRFDFVLSIINEGRGIAKYPAIRIKNCNVSMYGLDGNGNNGLNRLPAIGNESFFAGGSSIAIYPGMKHGVTVLRYEFEPLAVWPDYICDYELFAENMTTVTGSITFKGMDLYKRFNVIR